MAEVPINPEIPISVERFARTLTKTADEVWTRLLTLDHPRSKKLLAGWKQALEDTKARSV